MYNTTDKYNIETIYNKLIETKTNNINAETYKTIDKYFQKGSNEQQILLNLIINRLIIKQEKPLSIDGLIFDYLKQSNLNNITNQLNESFPKGIIKLTNSLKIDYNPLQTLLMNKQFKEADTITQKYLCQLAGLNQLNKRNWLYFTDISCIPSEDLFTIDLLWQIYSHGKFGFSIQRKIWIFNNNNWNKLWQQIGWINKGIMRRYPEEFIWNINAPIGHLPLFNQLRGNQVLLSLFEHPVWEKNFKF
uniref:GUN4-like domain-containing protein n=1 Tax=Sphondylothamnion multifidum TaxID=193186 RepID=A0A4D6X4X1_9FLOR|nr:hypothetical protein [Sphondylothamnion multifidum]